MAPLNDDRLAMARLFPWLRLIARMRFRTTFDPRKLALAAVALLIIQFGWSGMDWLLGTPARTLTLFDPNERSLVTTSAWDFATLNRLFLAPIRLGYIVFWGSLGGGLGWLGMIRGLLALAWFYVIGGLVGGAICRMIMVEIGPGGRVGLKESLRFAWRSRTSIVLAPLGPLLLFFPCALVVVLYGLVYRIPGLGPALGGIGLIVPLVLGFLMTLVAILLFLGWPLMLAAVASGADDALDVISRVISYLQQRLGTLVIPLVYAYLFGILGLAFVRLLEDYTIRVVLWGLSFGGSEHAWVLFPGNPSAGDVAALTHMGWMAAIRLMVSGWVWCYYATTACYAYLWLRQEVDGAPWDEIDRPAPLATRGGSTGADDAS